MAGSHNGHYLSIQCIEKAFLLPRTFVANCNSRRVFARCARPSVKQRVGFDPGNQGVASHCAQRKPFLPVAPKGFS
jgi:hypothetical protein